MSERLVTSALRQGDVVRLREDARKVGTFGTDHRSADDIQCYGCNGDLIEGNDFLSVPTWWFQGNDRASWCVVERGGQ